VEWVAFFSQEGDPMLPRHAVLSFLALSIGTTLAGQEGWKFAASQDITFMRLTPFGTVVVSIPDRLVALDPATGQPIWTREDIKNLSEGAFDIIPLSPYGVVRSRNGIGLLNLQTGATLWDSTAVPLDDVRGYIHVLEHRMLLLYGHKKPEGRALVAMDIDSGKVRWKQQALLRSDPELWETDNVHSLRGHQPPLVDSDSTLILYINKDGPFKVHAATGQLLWRVDQLKGEDPPTLAKAYPPMALGDSILLVPYGKKLMAVNPRDGAVLWHHTDKFKSPLTQIHLTSRGVLLRGARPVEEKKGLSLPDAFLDLLDATGGKSLWPRPFTEMKHEALAPFLVVGDTAYLGDRERLFAVALQDGAFRQVTNYKFEGGEEPVTVEPRGEQLLLLSAHNLVLFNTHDAKQVIRYYPAPGSSFLSKLGKVALFTLSAMSQEYTAGQMARPGLHVTPTYTYNPFIKQRVQGVVRAAETYTFMYTKAPDAAGRDGFSLVRLRKADGQEAGRLWFDDRSPEYLLDVASSTVYWKHGDREIVARKFAEP
jgi:outer membrane protein assembly factor BamB